MATRRVAWRRSDEVETEELLTMTIRDAGLSLVGTVLGAESGVPLRIEYRVMADGSAMTKAAHIRDLRGFEQRELMVERSAKGVWSVDGKVHRALKGCTDVDLGCTPSTNTLPIRRLRLAIGASQTIQAAWIRFPELTVTKSNQTYTRVDESTYHYESGTFSAEIFVDDDALVASYPPWRRTAIAIGPEGTAPLDAQQPLR